MGAKNRSQHARPSEESERQTLQHRWLKYNMKKLIFAPINPAKPNMRILESVTGNGAWILDVMEHLPPCATFVGTDVSPKWFPRDLPKSVTLTTQNLEDPWPPSWAASFDLVHQRLALSSCPTDMARIAVGRLFRLVKPGGWIQLVECDNHQLFGPDCISEHPDIVRFADIISKCFAYAGHEEVHPSHRLEGWLEEAGAMSITAKAIEIPVGCESANMELGAVTTMNVVTVVKRLKSLLLGKGFPGFPSSLDEFDALQQGVLNVLNTFGATQTIRVVYGRKPLTSRFL